VKSSLPLLCALPTLAVGCGGSSGDDGFEYGDSRTLSVAGLTEIYDPVSGLSFGFPEGGRGTLTISEILSAPERPVAGGRGWRLEADSLDAVTVRAPVGADEEAACRAWGFLEGSADDGAPRDGRWIPVPGEDLGDGTWAYDWVAPFQIVSPSIARLAQAALVPRSGHLGSSQYWINQVKPGAAEVDRRVAIGLQMGSDIDAWVAALPAGRAAVARLRVTGLRPSRHYDGNYYIGFTRRALWNTVTPMIGLRLDADADSIAHEVGHYMTHVLAGDDAYLTIENTAPDENHGLGVAQPGRILVEDYAYFSQFFLTGSVRGADPTLSRLLLSNQDPRKVDLPTVEGFGTALLAAMVRTAGSTVGQLSKTEEPVPVVGAAFGDVLALYSAGAVTLDALWPRLESLVAARGRAGALPVLAERAGWSYAASGRVLDANGQPLADVPVVNVLAVGSVDYDTGQAGKTKTGKDGRFRLTRVFPGSSTLRVDLPTGRKDVSIRVDPTTPTTKEADLGDVVGVGGPDSLAECEVWFAAKLTWEGDPGLYVQDIGVSSPGAYGHPNDPTTTFSANTLRTVWQELPIGAGEYTNGSIEVVFSPAHDRVLSFSASERENMGDVVTHWEESLDGTDLPLTGVQGGEWLFEIKGAAACGHVSRAVKVSRIDDGTAYLNVTGYSCDADSSVAVRCR
jgi:hypothetical protein